MREIKLRAWDKKLKRICKVYAISFKNERIVVYYESEDEPSNWLKLDRFILMQYTGLKDNNGKEIYEGDIVKNLSEDGYPIRGLVFYDDGSFKVTSSHADITNKNIYDILDENLIEDNNMKIIGNKYENPELLK